MLAPNTLLQDRYLVMRLLGQGGMGAVYQATDRKFGNAVAIKETFYSDLNLRKAFSHEARLLNRLRHAALPVVTDYFGIGDKQFLVMQYIPGKDLEQLLHERKDAGQGVFLTSQVLRWADQLLDALEYLHSQKPSIIHRDIKPQNLKLTPRGEVILLDFGLAKGIVTHQSHESQSIRGYTPNYASLEQIRGTGTDARSDIYSMGATLYHLLTGEMPPDALTRIAAILMGQADPLKPIAQLNQEVPPMVAAVIEKAMAAHPDQRFSSAAMMRQSLRNANQNIPSVGLHRDPTLTDEPVKRDAAAASAILGTPQPADALQPSASRSRPSRPEPQPAKPDDHVIVLLDKAKQKMAQKQQELLDKKQQGANGKPRQQKIMAPPRTPDPVLQPDVLVARPQRGARKDRKRAVTLTGSRSKAIGYGAVASLIVLVCLGLLTYSTSSLSKSTVTKGPRLTTENLGVEVNPDKIQMELLRYYLEVIQAGNENRRDTEIAPLPSGSKFKFHFKPSKNGYLYIIAPGDKGSPQTFLTTQPMAATGVNTNWTDGGKEFLFPNGGQWFEIQPDAELTQFTVIFSPKPLASPRFLSEPSGHDLSESEQAELQAFRDKYAFNRAKLVAVNDGNRNAMTVQVPSDYPTGDPLLFNVELKRR
jgi:serine/threonine protein kinase